MPSHVICYVLRFVIKHLINDIVSNLIVCVDSGCESRRIWKGRIRTGDVYDLKWASKGIICKQLCFRASSPAVLSSDSRPFMHSCIFIFHLQNRQCDTGLCFILVCSLIYSQKWQCHETKKISFNIACNNSSRERWTRRKKIVAHKKPIQCSELQAVEWKNI